MLSKIKEATIPVFILFAVVGLIFAVGLVHFDGNLFLHFSLCCLGLIVGQVVFLFGDDNSVLKFGKHAGVSLMQSKKMYLIILFGGIFGFFATLAEPDLQLLTKFLNAVSSDINKFLFMAAVGLGVGFFVCLAFFRILKGIKLRYFLIGTYALIFVLAIFSPNEYLALSFDASGITTGPITVPFLMALTIGICSARTTNKKEDNFGVIALGSAGPILAVLILSYFYPASASTFALENNSFVEVLIDNIASVCIAFLPIIVIFVIMQLIAFKFPQKQLFKLLLNFLICAFGLVIFLTSAVYGFSPMGIYIGQKMESTAVLILLVLLFGLVLVFTEPAIKILLNQIEDITSGSIKPFSIVLSLVIAISLSLLMSLLRVFFDFSMWYYLAPCIILALSLTFFSPPLFYSIGFDSGGVVSGTMLVAFVLPFFIGIANRTHGSAFSAFGTVALCALLPIISIEILGIVYKIKLKKSKQKENQ